MSTKIYDAYRSSGDGLISKEISNYIGRLFKFRKKIESEIKVELLNYLVDRKPKDFSKFLTEWEKIMRRGQWEELSWKSSAVIYTHPSVSYFAVQFFGFDRSQTLPVRGLQDWHYQNQCDQPDEVTDKEWKERKMFWDKIFKENSTPMLAGLSFPVFEESQCFGILHQVWPEYRKFNPANKD